MDKTVKPFLGVLSKIHFKMLIYLMEKHWRKVLPKVTAAAAGLRPRPHKWSSTRAGARCSQVTGGVDEWPCPPPRLSLPSPGAPADHILLLLRSSRWTCPPRPLRSTPVLPCSWWCQTFHPIKSTLHFSAFRPLCNPHFFSPWQPQIEPAQSLHNLENRIDSLETNHNIQITNLWKEQRTYTGRKMVFKELVLGKLDGHAKIINCYLTLLCRNQTQNGLKTWLQDPKPQNSQEKA